MLNYQTLKNEIKNQIKELQNLGYTEKSYTIISLTNIHNLVINNKNNQVELKELNVKFEGMQRYIDTNLIK